MLYLTADLHLGHANIITLGLGRPFGSIVEHDRAIIANINDTVSATDTLWILGDVGLHLKADGYWRYRGCINCRHVHLVLGNHDREDRAANSGAFESMQDYARLGRLSRDGYRAVLFHYPILDWDGMYRGSYMLHGHIHSRPAGAEGTSDPALLGTTHAHAVGGYNDLMRRQGIRRYGRLRGRQPRELPHPGGPAPRAALGWGGGRGGRGNLPPAPGRHLRPAGWRRHGARLVHGRRLVHRPVVAHRGRGLVAGGDSG